MQVRVLGSVDVRGDDGEPIAVPQRRDRELLSILVLAGGPVSPVRIQAMLGVAADTRRMVPAPAISMNRLRELLPEDRLVRDETGYRLVLDRERDYLDVREFRDLVTAARGVRETDPPAAAELFQQAVELWREPALPDLPDSPAVAGQARGLLAERRDAIEAIVEVLMVLGRNAVVLRRLPIFLAGDALNDRLWRSLLLALYRDGRRGDALRTFEDAREMYLTVTGREPSAPLRSMRDRIAAHDPGLDWQPGRTANESRAINAGGGLNAASGARAYG